MMKQLLILTGVMLLGLEFPLSAQRTTFINDSLDIYIEEALEMWQVPGMAVFIIKDDTIVRCRGYGVKEMGQAEKVDSLTLFQIGSNTKAFTGMALAMLEAEGKCSMDDKVKQYLPGLMMKDPWVAENLSLTDVLSHRMGTRTFQGDFMFWGSALDRDEVIARYGQLTPSFAFRTQYGYCNAGYAIAGKCIEKITNRSWERFIREEILDPLGMNETLLLTAGLDNAANAAIPHTMVNRELKVIPYCISDNLAPAGSISSSANDMGHWISALLNEGFYGRKSVIPEEAIRKAQSPVTIIGSAFHPFHRSHFALYGLGWEMTDYEGYQLISHTGGVHGFLSAVALLPEKNLGVVVLTNTDMNWLFEALQWTIIDAYLNLPFINYSGIYHSFFDINMDTRQKELASWQDSVAQHPEPPVPLGEFAGTYQHEIYGKAFVQTQGDHLVMTFEHHPDLTATLGYMGNNRFLCTYSNPMQGIKVFPFVIKSGKVRSFTLSVDDFLEMTTYDFVKVL